MLGLVPVPVSVLELVPVLVPLPGLVPVVPPVLVLMPVLLLPLPGCCRGLLGRLTRRDA